MVRAPIERPTTIYLNDSEWLTVQTTPVNLDDWAVGYLFGEGVIDNPRQIVRLVIDEEKGLVWADLAEGCEPPAEPLEFSPIQSAPQASEAAILRWMQEMMAAAALYHETGGMHVAMVVRTDTDERIVREDIGRHNAVDKAVGAALKEGWPSDRTVVLASGRISYEMCTRLARFGCGIGVSRTAATDQAYRLAMTLGIELVGYARSAASLVTYTPGKRIRRRETA